MKDEVSTIKERMIDVSTTLHDRMDSFDQKISRLIEVIEILNK